MSKCPIVGNHMSRLNLFLFAILCEDIHSHYVSINVGMCRSKHMNLFEGCVLSLVHGQLLFILSRVQQIILRFNWT